MSNMQPPIEGISKQIAQLITDNSQYYEKRTNLLEHTIVHNHDVTLQLLLDMQKQMNSMQTQMNIMQREMIEIKSDVSVLKSDVSVLKSDVSTIKLDISSMRQDIIAILEHVTK